MKTRLVVEIVVIITVPIPSVRCAVPTIRGTCKAGHRRTDPSYKIASAKSVATPAVSIAAPSILVYPIAAWPRWHKRYYRPRTWNRPWSGPRTGSWTRPRTRSGTGSRAWPRAWHTRTMTGTAARRSALSAARRTKTIRHIKTPFKVFCLIYCYILCIYVLQCSD